MEKLEASAAKTPATTANATDHRESRSMSQVGLKIESVFCPEDVASPFDTVEWDVRTASIKGEGGDVVFEQKDCEIPATWSQLATNVVVSKYFYGENGTGERERSVRQLIHRVTPDDRRLGYRRRLFRHGRGRRAFLSRSDLAVPAPARLVQLARLVQRRASTISTASKGASCNWHWDPETDRVVQPENPYEYPQASACFIQSVQDNMEDIMELARSEAMLFKFGSGTGTDLSTLRSHREKLAGGGKPSGPLSFMRVYDQIAAVVKSGGKTRRAAKMQSLKVWHPDILEFIECKCNEEKKALAADRGGLRRRTKPTARSSSRTPISRSACPTTSWRRSRPDKPWQTHWVTDETPRRPDPSGQGIDGPAGPGGVELRRSGRAVRHDDQPLAHLPELGPDQRLESVQRVHVPRRFGLQPGEHQPDEVPPGRRAVRRRAIQAGVPARLHRPGNPGRSRQLSDEANRRQQPSFPAAGLGLLEPRQPADGRRLALRFGRRPGTLRRDHGVVARVGQSRQRRVGRDRRDRSTATTRTASRCFA